MTFDSSLIQKILQAALDAGADFSEVYFEDRLTTVVEVEDNQVRPPRLGSECGAGIRARAGDTWGYAYAEDLTETTLKEAARTATALACRGRPAPAVPIRAAALRTPSGWGRPAELFEGERRRDLVLRANDAARSAGAEVKQVTVTLVDSSRRVLVANSAGQASSDERLYTRLSVRAVAARGDVLQIGVDNRGGQAGLDLYGPGVPEEIGRHAGRIAIRMLDAVPAPAGQIPVVVGNGRGGVLIHEACGHCLEGDFIARGISPYRGKIGEQVASPLVTVIDDGTVPGKVGSYAVDDEGTPAQRTVLIEKGELRGYMLDQFYAQKMGMTSTGSARRESFRCTPMVRMRNTFIAPGETSPEEIIADTPYGLYVVGMGGGRADLGRGDFLFSTMEAYLIEGGKITKPVRGATLIGNGFDVLKSIDAVGNDWKLSEGMCGKIQSAVVSVGQPTIRIPRLTVGGTSLA